MREITFKGKKLRNGEWVEGSLLVYGEPAGNKKTYIVANEEEESPSEMLSKLYWAVIEHRFEVDPETVSQFTGVKDKNKTPVYEGDIVKAVMGTTGFLGPIEIIAKVDFRGGSFGLVWNRGAVEEFAAFTGICNMTYEVVGNVHDTPQLFERGV